MTFKSKRRRPRCRATALIQAMVAVVVLGAMTSLSVDVGMFFTAKAELQRAADAAALAAAEVMNSSGNPADATAEAVRFVQANSITGQTLDATAISVVYYGKVNGTLVPGITPVRAVKVTLHRSKQIGNPVRLYFAQFIGLDTIDAHAVSTAKIRPKAAKYNIVGIDSMTFGSLGVLAKINGRAVSNGDVSIGSPLGLSVSVTGDVRSYGGTVRRGSMVSIGGSTACLSDSLEYPSVGRPPANNNALIGSLLDAQNDFNALGTVTIPPGTYVVRNLNLLAGVVLKLQGTVTFYVTGVFNIGATVLLGNSATFDPELFRVRVLSGGTVNFVATILTQLNMDLYAPDSDITIVVGLSSFYGRIVARNLQVALPVASVLTEDQAMNDPLADLPAVTLAN